jgi:hypothetical protein
MMRRRLWCLAALVLLGAAAPARADGPGVGTPSVVAIGDSAISGEAGRWAGNTNGDPANVDALGPTAYYDNASNTAETIPGCHRSKSAEVFIGAGYNSANLACSGARTYSQAGSDPWKPGVDFYDDGAGHIGQAKLLQAYAATHNVKAVTVLIGANDYGFADIVQSCVEDWLTSPSWWKNYCNDDSSNVARFTSSSIAAKTAAVRGALMNVRQAMANDGYADSSYKILAQLYSSPIPYGSSFRYPESGWSRQSTGGCGTWNADANWANSTVVTDLNNTVRNAASQTGLSNVAILDDSAALVGHRLCENTVGLLEEKGLASWRSAGAADKTEWVSQIRTTSTLFGPYQLQEDAHPSYWGQLALRNCLRQAFNAGAAHGGTCTSTGGLDSRGEPNMSLH